VKIREWWRKIRLRTFEGDDRPVDNIDAMSTTAGAGVSDTGGYGIGTAPTNWVPSQQDERPRH
jgi:hypothetical protein